MIKVEPSYVLITFLSASLDSLEFFENPFYLCSAREVLEWKIEVLA